MAKQRTCLNTLDTVHDSASGGILADLKTLFLWMLNLVRRMVAGIKSYARHRQGANLSIQQLIESMPVGVILVDKNRVIRNINQTALAMIGAQNAEEQIGLKCTDLLCSLEEDHCPLNSEQGDRFCNEIHLRSQSGSNPVVLRKASSLRLNGELMVMETLVDISTQKYDQQEIIEKSNYINRILGVAAVGIIVVDGTDFTIVEANPAALTMIGACREVIVGSLYHQWIGTRATEKEPGKSPLESVHNAESELITVNGGCVPIVKNGSMVMLNGRMHFVESFIDITRLKAAEEEARKLNHKLEQRVVERTAQLENTNQDLKNTLQDLKQTQSLLFQSEKMASIGQLAAGMAHEINNPIGFVKSNLNAIDDYRKDLIRLIQSYEALTACLNSSACQDGEVGQHLDAADHIKQEIDLNFIMDDFENAVSESDEGLMRVAKVVSDLKKFANMKADDADWMNINAGIESTLNIVWSQLKEKIQVEKELGPLPPVRCYPKHINQVLMNLLGNAVQAIGEHGRIKIKTSADKGYVTIEISDNGQGITPDNLNKIFEPFFTTKEVGRGSGLGLNVAYNIIKSHKGRITVDSTPGQGSTFTIRLPVEPDFDETGAEA